MKRLSLALLAFALGLVVLGAVGANTANDVALPSGATVAENGRGETDAGAVALDASEYDADIITTEEDAARRARAEVRNLLRREQGGTYIGEILEQRDSSIARWPDRHGRPLAVWIQPSSYVADWSTQYVDSVRAAFAEWNDVDLPVAFAFVRDSASADVHVSWIDHFDEPISGRTKWARNGQWWITDADIVLAVHHHEGAVLAGDAMKAMALHEIGHLIGLDHTTNSACIMAPRVRVRNLSATDVATARLVYSLPPGAIR